jgi:hypothetical protein
MSSIIQRLGLQGSEAAQMGYTAVCHTPVPRQVKMLQRGEATQVGDATVCQTPVPKQVEMLQRDAATQVGDAAACHTDVRGAGLKYCSGERLLRWAMQLPVTLMCEGPA